MMPALKNEPMLLLIRLVHTLIWAFFVFVIGYIGYAGIFDEIDVRVALAIGFIILEGAVLWLNNGSCPLTAIAAKYTKARSENFDIFLPNWLAKHNKIIFGPMALCGALFVAYRLLT